MARLSEAAEHARKRISRSLHGGRLADEDSAEHGDPVVHEEFVDAPEAAVISDHDLADVLNDNPAFRPGIIFERPPPTVDSVMGKTAHALRTAAKAARHPVSAAKHKAAKTMAPKDTPYLSAEADRAFLHAHEELTQAEVNWTEDPDNEATLMRLRSNMDELEETRSSMKAAWITTRFVQRAGVVRAQPFRLPDRQDPLYWKADATNGQKIFRPELFLAHLLRYAHQDYNTQYFSDVDEVPFDKDILLSHLERLLVASGPWQAWLLRLRKLSRWENPSESAKWFAIWVVIWISNHVITAVLLWIMYITIKHRIAPASRDSLRESYERAVDRSASAYRFNELVSRHGEAKWLEPLIEKCGPVVQMQIADTADHLEVMRNFYDWTNTAPTVATLGFFATAVAFGNATSVDFVMRSVTMLAIGYFFLCRPVASWHPKYRHMVTPFKWIFWDIPTNADWAFQYLQTKTASLARDRHDGTCASTEAPPLRSFSCFRNRKPGHLSVSASHLTFRGALGSKTELSWPLHHLDQLCKVDRRAVKSLTKLRSPRALQIVFADGRLEIFEGMRRRDEAFNTVIGLSTFMWKQLPSLPCPDMETRDAEVLGGVIESEEWFDAQP